MQPDSLHYMRRAEFRMDRNQLIITTAIALFAAFLLGWLAAFIVAQLSRVTRADLDELDRMADRLSQTEAERDDAIARLESREAVLSSDLTASEQEVSRLQDKLRDASLEIEELRSYIDEALGG